MNTAECHDPCLDQFAATFVCFDNDDSVRFFIVKSSMPSWSILFYLLFNNNDLERPQRTCMWTAKFYTQPII